MMKRKNNVQYWVARLKRDSSLLSENKKFELTRILLEYGIPLQREEASSFLTIDLTLGDLDQMMKYSTIERKIAEVYSTKMDLFDNPQRRKQFLKEFRVALQGFYTKKELSEVTAYMVEGGADLAVAWLVGLKHPLFRRIRNAYLPEITDLIEISKEGANDVTYRLFDGKEDAVSQIDGLLKDMSRPN